MPRHSATSSLPPQKDKVDFPKGMLSGSHNERCKDCKENIRLLLTKIYGQVKERQTLDVGSHVEDFEGAPCYSNLREIFNALQEYRGFGNFIRARSLPPSDFFIPEPAFLIEFDESQHFTTPRRIALEHYPNWLQLGFDRMKWIALAGNLNKKDNDPPYRDEQRAWYDTVRDFLPSLKGFKPTVRLFARDLVWCSLDVGNSSDLARFRVALRIGTGS